MQRLPISQTAKAYNAPAFHLPDWLLEPLPMALLDA